jgi:2-dehydropantoate 2-reductase
MHASEACPEPGIVFAGAGAMGRALAVLLSSSGTAATLLTREATARALVEQGTLKLAGLTDLEVPTLPGPGAPGKLGLICDPAQLPDGCGLVLTTKGPQLREFVATISAATRHHGQTIGWVAGLQNGIVKDEILADGFGPARVLPMVSTLNARIDSPLTAIVSGWGHTYVGSRPGGEQQAAAFAAALQRAQIPTTLTQSDTIDTVIWMKCINAVGVFGVTALTRLPNNVAFTSPELVRAYMALADEAAALGRAYGIELADFEGIPLKTRLGQDRETSVAEMVAETCEIPRLPAAYSSMAQDVIAGRTTEVESIFGDLVQRARRADVDVPKMTLAYQLIAGEAVTAS